MKLEQAVAAYVASKQSVGMRFVTEARTLKSFCRTLGEVDIDHIEARWVRAFLDGNGPVTRFWHRKLDALRGFYRFAVARGYVTVAGYSTVASSSCCQGRRQTGVAGPAMRRAISRSSISGSAG